MSDWPHAPPHRMSEQGAYRVTCGTHATYATYATHATYGTYANAHFLHAAGMLDMLRELLPTQSGVKPPHSK